MAMELCRRITDQTAAELKARQATWSHLRVIFVRIREAGKGRNDRRLRVSFRWRDIVQSLPLSSTSFVSLVSPIPTVQPFLIDQLLLLLENIEHPLGNAHPLDGVHVVDLLDFR